jgi:CheY-like chemotaxis protein
VSDETHNQTTPVLLVEDDPDDVEITRRAFKKGHILNPLYVVRDGEEALEFLCRTGRYAPPKRVPRPGIVLLDLNLPRVDGREVLREVKGDPDLKRIPVIVLTTSDEAADVLGCYDQGCNTYMTKPVDFEKFIQAVITIGRYWLCLAEIPPEEGDR